MWSKACLSTDNQEHLNETMAKEEKRGLERGTADVLLASQRDETAALPKSAENERNSFHTCVQHSRL